MSWATLLGLLVLLAGVPLNLYVLWMLRKLHRDDPNPVLAVLIIVWTLMLLIALVFGAVFVNNDQPMPPLDTDSTKLITRAAVLALVTIPAVSLVMVYRDRT